MTPGGEIELPRKSPPPDRDPDLVGGCMALAHWMAKPSVMLHWWSFLEVFPMELASNVPFRM